MSKEAPIDEAELNALLESLDAEINGALSEPPSSVVTAKTAPSPKPDAEELDAEALAELEATLTAAPPAPAPAPAPEPAPAPIESPKVESPPWEEPKAVAEVEPAAAPAPAAAESTFSPDELKDDKTTPKSKAATLNYYVDVEQFKRDTAVSETRLDDCIMQQAGLRAHYGTQAANAEAQHARLKARFDVKEAALYDKHRKLIAASGEKATEKAIENAVKLDPEWLRAKNAVIEAETIAAINRSLVFSLADRRDMLIQLGSDRRQEQAGQLRIVARDAEKESLGARALAAAQRAM